MKIALFFLPVLVLILTAFITRDLFWSLMSGVGLGIWLFYVFILRKSKK